MPINFETPTGYYDDRGTFHPNTGLLSTVIPGVSVTIPINPSQPYDFWPNVQPYLPINTFRLPEIPALPDLPDIFRGIEDTGRDVKTAADNAALIAQLGLIVAAYVAFSSAGGFKGIKKGLGI